MISKLALLKFGLQHRRAVTAFQNIIYRLSSTKTTMADQRKISTFFNPLRQKRQNEEVEPDSAKKPKLVEKTPEKKEAEGSENITNTESPEKNMSSPPAVLSPELKSKMDDNRMKAKIKLTEKQTKGLVTNIGASWYKALEPEFTKPYFVKLADFVSSERAKGKIFPPAADVFSWTQMGHIRDIKVVILGQDPYHGIGQAHGICFSVQQGIAIPPSLLNMYKELETDIEGFKRPSHGYLTGWAKQGVLLLNACLTVRAHNANSHKDQGWEKFTDAVISWLNKNGSGVTFILWGAYAQKKGACIDKKKHHILKGPHPSPLSAHRGFFGCKHFSACNKILEKQGKTAIDWTDLPSQEL